MRNYEHEKVVLFQVIVLTIFQMMKSNTVRIICHILRVRLVGLHHILTRRTKISVYLAVITIGPICVRWSVNPKLGKSIQEKAFVVFYVWIKVISVEIVQKQKHCEGLLNSAICNKKRNSLEKLGNRTNKTNTNAVHNKTPVLLQTAEILLGNPKNNQIVK